MGLSAHRYLYQLKEIKVKIEHDQERLKQLRQDAQSLGAIDYSEDRVQTSPTGDSLCSRVARIVDIENEIKEKQVRLLEIRERIIEKIYEVHEPNYIQILYKIYVEFKEVKGAACEMGISRSHGYTLRKEALHAFKFIHGDELRRIDI